jgi:hypothetical protein
MLIIGLVRGRRYSIYERESTRLLQNAVYIEYGMTEMQVIKILGKPIKKLWVEMADVKKEIKGYLFLSDKLSQLEKKHKHLLRYWYYIIRQPHSTSVNIYFDCEGGNVVLITSQSFIVSIMPDREQVSVGSEIRTGIDLF